MPCLPDGSPPDVCSWLMESPAWMCSNPCNTGNATLDDPNVQQAMHEAWKESYGTGNDPLPHSQRVEKLFLVTATSGGYEYEEIIPDAASSCHITTGSGLTSVPSNLVGFIHTHPYKHNDIITDPNCPKTQDGPFQYDGNVVSDGDEALVTAIHNQSGLTFDMCVIDKEKIRTITTYNPSIYSDTNNRCGY